MSKSSAANMRSNRKSKTRKRAREHTTLKTSKESPGLNLRSIGGANVDDALMGPDCLDEFRSNGLLWSRRKLAPRQHAFLQGDDQSHVYLVQAGVVRLYTMLSNGRRQIIGFKSAGDFVALDYEFDRIVLARKQSRRPNCAVSRPRLFTRSPAKIRSFC